VIRRHLINGLEDIFFPAVVAGWTDEEIAVAAAEPKATTVKRQDLEDRLGRLKKVFKEAERTAVKLDMNEKWCMVGQRVEGMAYFWCTVDASGRVLYS
jgi:hypothetical protein